MGFNLYALAGGALILLGLGGTIAFQNGQIHHYHVHADCIEFGQGCPKNFKGDTLVSLRGTITAMTDAQNNQTGKSDANVIRVVQGPRELQTIIKEIHDAPVSGPCTPPKYKEDVNDAF
jgi:hypothetical protein